MKIAKILLAQCALLACGYCQDVEQKAPTSAMLEQGWRETLAQVAAMERISLFVDVNVNAGVVEAFYSKPAGKRAMETLARCLDRHWESIDGHQVFSRSSPLGTVRPPASWKKERWR